MNNSITSCMAALALMGAAPALADPSTTDTQAVLTFEAVPQLTGGESHLTRTDDTILVVLEANELVPGDAHTLWFIVFNNPAACTDMSCGEDDIFNMDGTLNVPGVMAAGIGIGNATGNVAKADGTLEFGARLSMNAGPADGHQIVFPAGLDFELDSLLTSAPADAEVHLIVQTHGQARGGKKLQEQLSYLDANCTPSCADIQFTVHLAP